jgi:hypothetical protein
VSADKMFWTSNKPAKWTLYIFVLFVVLIREIKRTAHTGNHFNERNMTSVTSLPKQLFIPESYDNSENLCIIRTHHLPPTSVINGQHELIILL